MSIVHLQLQQHRQFPVTLAYAFTDYRSQGQTIPHVIIDIASPPTGDSVCSTFTWRYLEVQGDRQSDYFEILMQSSF